MRINRLATGVGVLFLAATGVLVGMLQKEAADHKKAVSDSDFCVVNCAFDAANCPECPSTQTACDANCNDCCYRNYCASADCCPVCASCDGIQWDALSNNDIDSKYFTYRESLACVDRNELGAGIPTGGTSDAKISKHQLAAACLADPACLSFEMDLTSQVGHLSSSCTQDIATAFENVDGWYKNS